MVPAANAEEAVVADLEHGREAVVVVVYGQEHAGGPAVGQRLRRVPVRDRNPLDGRDSPDGISRQRPVTVTRP